MSSDRLPPPSGARLAGDNYQHMFTWLHAAQLLRDVAGIERIEFEARNAGNVDDLVVYRRDGAPLYRQIKFVRDQREPLTTDWFTTVPADATKSPLQRFLKSFRDLTTDGVRPEMVLETNRLVAHGDPILKHLDGLTNRLVPRLFVGGPGSAAGRARAAWAQHLEIDQDELRELLSSLQIRAGRDSYEDLCEYCAAVMEAAQLRADRPALTLGASAIKDRIIVGTTILTADDVRELAAELGLHADAKRATLLVQALKPHARPEYANATVDCVDLFDGETPEERRQLKNPADWNERLAPDISAAVDEISRQGHRRVLVAGHFRLSTAFYVGTRLSKVAGFEVAIRQGAAEWSSEERAVARQVIATEHPIEQGDDLALGLSVSGDLSADVVAYLRESGAPIGRYVDLAPTGGPGRQAITDPQDALSLAYALSDALRGQARGHGGRVHLFQRTPAGLSLLVGHLWNLMPATQLYDDANPGYLPTFVL